MNRADSSEDVVRTEAEEELAARLQLEEEARDRWRREEEARIHREREARSVALEKTYVHDVYQQMAPLFSGSRRRPWPRVKQFLTELEPGSIVCDVGCGDGRYLNLNAETYMVGVDRCHRLVSTAAEQTSHQVLVCDNLRLPFRDECADAAVSVAVIHHLATTERRVRALRELARVLRIGGKLIVTVWAMEQRARKFESQDVLVPWDKPQAAAAAGASAAAASSDEKTSVGEPEPVTTSEDDLLNYCAYTQTSDSDSSKSTRYNLRRGGRRPRRIRAIDPTMVNSSQSSSDLSSPSETCYSFVRRALEKLAGNRRDEVVSSRPWLASAWSSQTDAAKSDKLEEVLASVGAHHLIEIRMDDDTCGLEAVPRRRNTLGSDSPASSSRDFNLSAFKSHSVGDMWSMISASIKSSRKLLTRPECERPIPLPSAAEVDAAVAADRPKSFACDGQIEKMPGNGSALHQPGSGRKANRKSVTFSTHSLTLPREREGLEAIGEKSKSDSVLDAGVRENDARRVSLTTVQEGDSRDGGSMESKPTLVRQKCVLDDSAHPALEGSTPSPPPIPGILKQKSLNENLMHSERFLERENIMSKMRKHRSLNDNIIYGKRPHVEASKDGLFSNYKRLKMLKDSLGKLSESIEQLSEGEASAATLKNGFVKIMKQWTEGTPVKDDTENSTAVLMNGTPQSKSAAYADVRAEAKVVNSTTTNQRSPPEFCGVEYSVIRAPSAAGVQTVVEHGDRRTLYRYCSRERKTSRDEGSDSSKENSFQSDTSLDSEDSCVSVIYVPKPEEIKERSRSVSSESSDEKQPSPKSPLSTILPASPTRLAASVGRHSQFKGPSKLGSQILFSNMQGRFQLMDPPLGSKPSIPQTCDRKTFSPSSSGGRLTSGTACVDKAYPDKFILRSNSLDSYKATEIATEAMNSIMASVPCLARANSLKWTPAMPDIPINPEQKPCDGKIKGNSKQETLGSEILKRHKGILAAHLTLPPSPIPPKISGSKFSFYSTSKDIDTADEDKLSQKSSETSTHNMHDSTEPNYKSDVNHKPCDSYSHKSVVTTQDCSYRPGVSRELSTLVMDENIEIIRRPGMKGICNVHVLGRPLPKYLTFEVFNPETDDLDSESSCTSGSSSPSSVCSVISLTSEWASAQEMLQPLAAHGGHDDQMTACDRDALMDHMLGENTVLDRLSPGLDPVCRVDISPTPPDSRSTGISPTPSESRNTGLSPTPSDSKRTGLSPTPLDYRMTGLSPPPSSRASLSPSPPDSTSRSGLSPPPPPGLLSAGGVSSDTRPNRSPPPPAGGYSWTTAAEAAVVESYGGGVASEIAMRHSISPRSRRKLAMARLDGPPLLEQVLEESNLGCGQHRGAGGSGRFSLVSSISSGSSLSTSEGGESWPRGSSSASLGGSERGALSPDLSSSAALSSEDGEMQPPRVPLRPTKHAPAATAAVPTPAGVSAAIKPSSPSDESLHSDHGGTLGHHRYYHVFREGELDKLIERYVDSLHIISSYYDHANWCVVAEKVQVWTI